MYGLAEGRQVTLEIQLHENTSKKYHICLTVRMTYASVLGSRSTGINHVMLKVYPRNTRYGDLELKISFHHMSFNAWGDHTFWSNFSTMTPALRVLKEHSTKSQARLINERITKHEDV